MPYAAAADSPAAALQMAGSTPARINHDRVADKLFIRVYIFNLSTWCPVVGVSLSSGTAIHQSTCSGEHVHHNQGVSQSRVADCIETH